MYHALDMGVTASDFWQMSPRAVWELTQERIRGMERRGDQQRRSDDGQRLSYIPR